MSYDPLSESFDAILALQNPSRVSLPYPNIRPLDTIAQCSRLIPLSLRASAGIFEKQTSEPRVQYGRGSDETSAYFKKRAYQQQVWLQGIMQEMILAPDERRNQGRVQVEWIDYYCRKAGQSKDKALRECVALCERKALVRVVMQGEASQGQIWYLGQLVAVDRQWNLILEQAQEWLVHQHSGEQQLIRSDIKRILLIGSLIGGLQPLQPI